MRDAERIASLRSAMPMSGRQADGARLPCAVGGMEAPISASNMHASRIDLRAYPPILSSTQFYGCENPQMSAATLTRPEECNCFAVRSAARHVTQFYDQFLAPSGLRTTQFAIL